MSINNKVILLGRLGQDPEVKNFDNGGKICNFSIATDESYTDKSGKRVERTEWHNIVFSGNVVDVVSRYFKKGSRILIEGKLRTRSWEQNGEKKYMTEVLARDFKFIDAKAVSNTSITAPMDNKDSSIGEEQDDLGF